MSMMYTGVKELKINFCESIREQLVKTLKKMILLIKEQQSHIKMKNTGIFVKKKLKINIGKIKRYRKIRDHFHYIGRYRGTAHNISN